MEAHKLQGQHVCFNLDLYQERRCCPAPGRTHYLRAVSPRQCRQLAQTIKQCGGFADLALYLFPLIRALDDFE